MSRKMKSQESRQLPPEKTLDADRFLDFEQSVRNSAIVRYALACIDRDDLKVCDVGGASGVFLNELMEKSPYRIQPFLLEVNPAYGNKLVNDKIHFIHSSILSGTIEDNSFDCVTFRHILHHLVGKNVKDTLANQARALAELFRITKPAGTLIFEEEVNNVRIFSRIVYRLSRLANRLKIRWRLFEAGRVVVSFMTRGEIRDVIDRNTGTYGLEIVETEYLRWHLHWKWRLTVLMGNVGAVLYVIRVNKQP